MSLASYNPLHGKLIYKKITSFDADRLTSMGTVDRFTMTDGICPDLEIPKFHIDMWKNDKLPDILKLAKSYEPHSISLNIYIEDSFDLKALVEYLTANTIPNLLKLTLDLLGHPLLRLIHKASTMSLPQILAKNSQIRILSLKGFFGNDVLKKLFSSEEFQNSITELDISHSLVTDCSFKLIVESIANNKNLKKLSFGCNSNDCASFNLSKLEKRNELFMSLNLESLHIQHDAKPSKHINYYNFVQALCHNTSLKSIDLAIENLDENSAGYILDNICKYNKKLQNLKFLYNDGTHLLNKKLNSYVKESQSLSNFTLTINNPYIRLEAINIDNTKIKYFNLSGVLEKYSYMLSFLDENFISKQNQMSIRHLELGCYFSNDLMHCGENTKDDENGPKLVERINSIKNALALTTLKIYLTDYKIEPKQISLKYFPNLIVLKNKIIDDNHKISQKIVEHILTICNKAKTRKEVVDGLKFKNIGSFKAFMLRNFSVRFIMQAVYLLHQGAIDYIFDNIAYANRDAMFQVTCKNNNSSIPQEIIDYIGYYLNKANMEDMNFVQYLNDQRNSVLKTKDL